MDEATRDAKVNAALAKIAEATQVACGRKDSLTEAAAARSDPAMALVINCRAALYHDACVELHQVCWEYVFLVSQK